MEITTEETAVAKQLAETLVSHLPASVNDHMPGHLIEFWTEVAANLTRDQRTMLAALGDLMDSPMMDVSVVIMAEQRKAVQA